MGNAALSQTERQSLTRYAANRTVDGMHRHIALTILRASKARTLELRGIQTLQDAR